MKKIFALMACLFIFVACDFTKESVKVRPDIDITYIKPIAAYIDIDSLVRASIKIEEIHFVPRNSVDCVIDRMVLEYYSSDGKERFLGPIEVPMYVKIKGIVDPEEVDTTVIEEIPLPVDTVVGYMLNKPANNAKALLQFISYDDYGDGTCDTARCWFGFYRTP
ncbi:MAG: hypothetical protein ABIL70_04950 [candidate division WOR-3 bacterium]